jgi:integrase/recombinase XerC
MAKRYVKCAVCKRALPRIETWRGRLHLCDDPDCKAKFDATRHAIYLREGERKCAQAQCDNTVPAGYYRPNPTLIACSQACRDKLVFNGAPKVCAFEGCKRPFMDRSHKVYCSVACRDAEYHARAVRRCGRWREHYLEYERFINDHYRGDGIEGARVGMLCWFEFLDTTSITDIADVDAKTVSDWITWGKKVGRSVQGYMPFLSLYMQWAIFRGFRTDNPVTRFHRRREPKRLPRPYSDSEMAEIWRLLEERGTPVARLAVAIAEESGLRVGEIANLRVSDVDLVGHRLFVRLPNKTMTERWAPYHDKVAKYLPVWMAQRGASVKHDHLLYQPNGRPYKNASLHYAIARVVCKTVKHKKVHDDGLDAWSTHRLRHVMATRLVSNGADAATVMSIGGWVTAESMAGYAAVEDHVADRGYREAMQRAAERKSQPQTKRSSFAKYVSRPPEQRPQL